LSKTSIINNRARLDKIFLDIFRKVSTDPSVRALLKNY